MNAIPSSDDQQLLPELRDDLIIEKAGPSWNGAPSWLIHDPLTNRFYRIGQETLELLGVWSKTSLDWFTLQASKKLGRPINKDDVDALCQFLFANRLTTTPPSGDFHLYHQQAQAQKKGLFQSLIHNYLFFRIPLLRPQKHLDAAWPIVRPLFSSGFVICMILLTLIALYLVSRQWQEFTSTFLSFLSLQGLLLYGVSLVLIKIFHELGHAFMARKYDVEVPTIGVAFMVLMPVLYTDTSQAARLGSRFKRLMIDFAGIQVELALAVIATLLWIFLPDGPIRSIAFATATLSWVLSLAVNLNPFMRFDGYYILSDTLGIENLQERGFALAKWRLRELLFKPNAPVPVVLEKSMRQLLILHAWGTWVYRFFLFLGIALLVYHFFIKAVAIVLFAVEIVWFILLPIYREVKVWWENRNGYFKSRRSKTTFAVFGVILLFFIWPWSTRVDIPVVMKAENEAGLFSPSPAILKRIEVRNGDFVKKNDVLWVLTSPFLNSQRDISFARKKLLELRVKRAAAEPTELSFLPVLKRELRAETEKLNGINKRISELTISAPFDGLIVDLDSQLHQNQWLGEGRQLAIIRSQYGARFVGMVEAATHERLQVPANGTFIPDDPQSQKLEVKLASLASISVPELEDESLADIHGGGVASLNAPETGLATRGTWFAATLELAENATEIKVEASMRGMVIMEAKPISIVSRVVRRVLSVIIRESGF